VCTRGGGRGGDLGGGGETLDITYVGALSSQCV